MDGTGPAMRALDLARWTGRLSPATDAYIGDVAESVPGPPPLVELPRLVIAPTMGQARHWVDVMGMDPYWAFVLDAGSRRAALTGYEPCEAFFVGEWGRLPVTLVQEALGWLRAREVPTTYVCDVRGEVVERCATWARWPAPSSGRRTSWHAVAGVARPVRQDESERWEMACGIPAPLAVPVPTTWNAPPIRGDFESGVGWKTRWGPPPGACRACVRWTSRLPAGTAPIRDEMRQVAAYAMVGLAARRAGRAFDRQVAAMRAAWRPWVAARPTRPI